MTLLDTIVVVPVLLVMAFFTGRWILRLTRGKRVGTLKLPGRVYPDLAFKGSIVRPLARVRLTVAREGGAAPIVQIRAVVSTALYMESIDAGEAIKLAQLLEEASSRVRAS